MSQPRLCTRYAQAGMMAVVYKAMGYKGRYKACLYPGQTMDEVSKATERQRVFNGSVIINDDFGFSFVLPAPYDEVADHIGDIPPGLVLDEVYVSDFSIWNPHR